MITASIRVTGLAICALWMAQQAQGGTLTLERVDSSPTPITVRAAPDGDPASGYVLGLLDGRLRAIGTDGSLNDTAAMDLSEFDDFDRAWDIAFAPDHAQSGKVYPSYNTMSPPAMKISNSTMSWRRSRATRTRTNLAVSIPTA